MAARPAARPGRSTAEVDFTGGAEPGSRARFAGVRPDVPAAMPIAPQRSIQSPFPVVRVTVGVAG
jgi:hypothetical protein